MKLAARIGPAVALPLAIAACGGGTTTKTTSTGPGNVNEKPSSPVNGQRTFSAPGMAVSGAVGTAGGLPAIYWPREPVAGLLVKATVMIVNVFVGKDEYELQCQATPAGLTQIEGACREMLATLTTQSSS